MYIVADIGGTKMRIARSDDLQSFAEPSIVVTPTDYEEAIREFVATAHTLAGSDAIETISIGVPAALSKDKQTLLRLENLPEWGGHALATDVSQKLSAKVFLENDVSLVGLGEAVFGAGKRSNICMYLSVSTGVNGVRIVDGAIDKSAMGFEIGGQYLSHDKLETFEELVGGRSIHHKYGVHPRELGADWEGWEELARLTAIGVHNAVTHWSPERIVLGGSMFNEIGISIDRVRAHLGDITKKYTSIPEVVHSALHDSGGLYGAMALLSQNANLKSKI